MIVLSDCSLVGDLLRFLLGWFLGLVRFGFALAAVIFVECGSTGAIV